MTFVDYMESLNVEFMNLKDSESGFNDLETTSLAQQCVNSFLNIGNDGNNHIAARIFNSSIHIASKRVGGQTEMINRLSKQVEIDSFLTAC